ncbi:hypothetical protein HanXRQr2_Chr11g0498721 [Helianthus annuus]|uniref:Uncharacterized protein n=1 Tax=Helianthus annuus TaxID=4232 RepID=A0A9K3HQR4_HELAN|nr:hypothetical protein HanXRQr2_Chr11g0498721 [Helianthus annuus]KAJ0875784.1 hypothetical protein HanPSC8_Chr11g0480571 [Helianthus annuus]
MHDPHIYTHLPSSRVEALWEDKFSREGTWRHKWQTNCDNSSYFLWVLESEWVRNNCSKVFANHKYLRVKNVERIKNRRSIFNKISKGSLLGFSRRFGQPVSSKIGCNSSKTSLCDRDHLVAPSVPYLWEPMKENHHWR